MALEDLTGTNKYIANLVNTNPLSADDRREGDDHIRGIKNVLLNTFPGLTAPVDLGALPYVKKAGDTMTGALTLTGTGSFVVAGGYVQGSGVAGPALFGNATHNYVGLQGAASANWSFQWTKADGSLRFLDGASVPQLTILGGTTTFAGDLNVGSAAKKFGFSGSSAAFQTNQLLLVGAGSPEVMAQLACSPAGMFQAVQFKHNPGVAASISLNVSGAGWRFTSGGESYNHLNSTAWNVTSDMRVKRDVSPYPYGLAELLKIAPVLYRFDDEGPEVPRRPGFNAQEVAGVMPAMLGRRSMEHARAAELGGLLTLQPDYAWFALINAVKTLAARVEALELLVAGGAGDA